MSGETERLTADDLREVWPVLDAEDRVLGFRQLDRAEAEDFFLELSPRSQSIVVAGVPAKERRSWIRLLEPDDAADLLQEVEPEERSGLMSLLDEPTRIEVSALLAYAEDAAGGLMSPRFTRVRAGMTVEEAIRYLRRQARENPETLYYVYVLDAEQRLRGVVSVRELFSAAADRRVEEVMEREVISVPENMDQEAVARLIASHDLMAVPVVDPEGRMRGIVTVDDIVDVVEEEATEDIQKLGGMEALDHPYLQTGVFAMVKKRAGWLAALFIGEMLTASVMGRLRERRRQRRGARPVHPADHLQRRQLRLPGHHPGDPRHGARRGAAARLVAGGAPRGRRRPGARRRAGGHRLRPESSSGRACSGPTASTSCASASPSP